MGDVKSSSFLWPIVSKTTGDRVERFRIFPFYGRSRVEGQWEKTFVLWPFWNSVRFLAPGTGHGWVLFPLTGHLKTTAQETWWAIPPLFRYTRGEPENRIFGPWPFFQKSSGEDVDRFYLWPLYGHKKIKNTLRAYALWPLCWYQVQDSVDRRLERSSVIPFLRSTAVYEKTEGVLAEEPMRRRFKLWPLFSYSRNREASRIHVPDLNPSRGGHLEQNWASFWQVFRRERIGDDVDTELFWGLYRSVIRGETLRHRSLFPLVDWGRDAEGRRLNILKGLLGVESRDGNREFRVLYFLRFGGESPHD
jgi:hypothetical protein